MREKLSVSPDAAGRVAPAPWTWRAFVGVMRRLPQGVLSRAFGRLADVPLARPLRRPVLGAFARMVGADIGEAEHGLAEYPTLDAFFTRRLRAGSRPQPSDPIAIVSPVDGTVASLGPIVDGVLVQAKGLTYTTAELLGDDAVAAGYLGGSFVTIYLSPRDYHRIHAPAGGRIGWARHEPGRLLPVNPPLVALEPRLFARNERLMCELAGPSGRIAVVAVGAINVGRISCAFDPSWNGSRGGVTNRAGATAATRRYEPPLAVERGAELMAFHLGSTVVVLLAPGCAPVVGGLGPGSPVRLGQPLARTAPSAPAVGGA